ncbi:hypothetical protein [Lolliginicoccus suaedae]|uniref:hypothetical protein n=1 Tax=Lolliginicoccus suaedae TaxID=2605429 RepID=UPI0011EF0551|nr:hypothetical protein [Lolliginicoccus suaedae]
MRRSAVLLAATLLVAGAACGNEPRQVAEVVGEAVCAIPAEAEHYGAIPPAELLPASDARPGAVPDGFEPVRAITCDRDLAREVSEDMTATFNEYRWEGDLSTAIRLLNGRDRAQKECVAHSGSRAPDLWLIDAAGSAVRARPPLDECGLHRFAAILEIRALEQIERVEHAVRFAPDSAARWLGCDGAQPVPVPGESPPRTEPFHVGRTCTYQQTGSGATTFAGGRIDYARFTEPLEPFYGPCSEVATRTVASMMRFPGDGGGLAMVVELDGCRRVLADGVVPMQASGELLAQLD